ncbi:MAG: TIGR04076 family protein [candidate division KSB1 bacterium]|nr:TIGR04076 family protein [candidate division KSB1 bacterium]
MEQAKNLILTVLTIKGFCPVYRPGDQIFITNGYILEGPKSGRVCLHSLASIMPYYVALSRGVRPVKLGLAKKDTGSAYIQCLDPCDLTGGGTVTFQVEVSSE